MEEYREKNKIIFIKRLEKTKKRILLEEKKYYKKKLFYKKIYTMIEKIELIIKRITLEYESNITFKVRKKMKNK